MQLQPRVFWRMTLAEWRAALGGYGERLKMERGSQAWAVSHLMNSTGNYKELVTANQLLGKPERKRKEKPDPPQMPIDQLWALVEQKPSPLEVSESLATPQG